jgi:uncharacterized membrane protein
VIDQAKLWMEALAAGVELATAAVIAVATVEAIVRAVTAFLRGRNTNDAAADVRLRLGRWLALSLDFALAADILRTAIAPSWNEIGQLAAIAALRTALNFFLEREMERAETRLSTERDVTVQFGH